ncbi:MAG: hypothetical protein Q9162_005098 [Coniocarpon cinnabarinum]
MIEDLGVKGVQFEELLSLDADSLLQLTPLYGVIFLFKFPTDSPYRGSSSSAPHDGQYDPSSSEAGLFFAHQTIQNACGTQALLSVLLNKDATSEAALTQAEEQHIDIGDVLRTFREFSSTLDPELRGEVLSNSEEIRKIHNAFARSSPFADETTKPEDSEREDVFHFIAYTPANGVLYELDGLQPHPISHGECDATSSDFAQKVIPVLQRRIERYPQTEIRFNLLAVCRDLRVRCRELGNEDGLEREERKRKDWAWENALRRHNFIGFAGEVVKAVASQKQREGGTEAVKGWLEEARKTTRKRLEERAKGKSGGEMDVDA